MSTFIHKKHVLRASLFALPGILAMLLAIPIAELPLEKPSSAMIAVAAPVYLGILAAPGFFYVALFDVRVNMVDIKRHWWLRISLILALLCSLGGMYGGLWMFLFFSPSLISAVITGYLLIRLETGAHQNRCS